MKALTIHQPWASLIAVGAKQIETRSWSTNYRGPLAIHASKRQVDLAWKVLDGPLPLGVIVATCELVDVVAMEDDGEGRLVFRSDAPENGGLASGKFIATRMRWERDLGDYTPGRYAWLLQDIKPLAEPIPAKGRQGLWTWEA